MRHFIVIASLALFIAVVEAEPTTPQSVAADVTAAARQDALEKILSERGSAEDFERALAAASSAGVGGQAILEARFLYQVDKGDEASVAAMLPDFQKQREVFKIDDSVIFSVEEEWLAVVEYVRAMAALVEGDKDAFKKHITEAFWLNPEQAGAFAPHIERMRMRDSMAGVVVDFRLKPEPLSGGEPQGLDALIKGKKALLLHFWSPWSRECAEAMPDFTATAESLIAKDIAVVSMIHAGMPGLIEEAEMMIRPHAGKSTGSWLVDPKNGSLARQLRVRKLPTMVIISTDGKVLFNGEPSDEKFWNVLHRIDARIIRPEENVDAR